MNRTKIPYADLTWNPFVGCTRVSPGCENCYAERLASTRLRHLQTYQAVTNGRGWNGRVELIPERLEEPIPRKKPSRIFVGDMSDLFHPNLSFEFIAAVFGVMAACYWHTFLLLTKRPERMLEWFNWVSSGAMLVPKHDGPIESTTCAWAAWKRVELPDYSISAGWQVAGSHRWPLSNVHLGVTCEDQKRANDRVHLLLQCPAAVRWVSGEPLLGAIDFGEVKWPPLKPYERYPIGLDWVVVGGESGPRARPCNVEWIRSIRDQCQHVGTACFVKQLGSNPGRYSPDARVFEELFLRDRAGADPSEWPEDLRVREWPEVAA